MKKAEEPSRIVGLTVGNIRVQLGATGEATIRSESVLQDKDGNVHGQTSFVGPWPKAVTDAAAELRERMEEFLLTIHFEYGAEEVPRSTAPGEDRKPSGLGLFGTGKTEKQL